MSENGVTCEKCGKPINVAFRFNWVKTKTGYVHEICWPR